MRELLCWCQGGKKTVHSSLFSSLWPDTVCMPGWAYLCMHRWRNLWKFRFHCTCTDQLSSTWTVTWTCRKKKVCCTWLHSLGDVTVTTHYANLAQLPTGYSCCNVTSNYSVSLQYEVWIVVCVCSHVLYTWLSTKIFLLAFSLLHCIKRILFYSLRIRTIPFVKCLLLSALLHLWYNWSFLNSQLSIYLSAL